MVGTTSKGRNGVKDFVLLRATALVMTVYTIYLIGFIATNELSQSVWQGFFAQTHTKVLTILTLMSLVYHAWIGLWQVLTDYVKAAALRIPLQLLIGVVALAYLLVGFDILWSIQ